MNKKLILLSSVLVAAFSAQAAVIEDFEDGDISNYTSVGGGVGTSVTAFNAHDGSFGLGVFTGNGGWIYRDDAGAQVSQGDTLSVWIRFDRLADSRAYFGFGASATGTMSFVLAPNTGDIRFQNNTGYGFNELNTSSQSFVADKWYRAEVVWGVGGGLTGNLYDSDGTTLLNTVTDNDNSITSGGIALRGFGSEKSFDTVEVNRTVTVPDAGSTGALLGFAVLGMLALSNYTRVSRQS